MIDVINEGIKRLIRESIREALDKVNVREGGITRDKIMDGITLYHRPSDREVIVGGQRMRTIDSLFKYGFSREFTSSNGGNMYGAGVYSVYSLKSSQEKATGYGSAIVMLKLLGGYKDFLIFSKQLAQETYGANWRIEDQIHYLFPDDAVEILQRIQLIMHDDTKGFDDIERSSNSAVAIVDYLGENKANNTKCRGYIYNGGWDGACCVIRDFQSVVPVAVSYDDGKTWEDRLTDELIDRMNNNVDTHFQLGANFQDVADKAINGYSIVYNNDGKANYVPSDSNEPISDVWFDNAFNFENKNGVFYAEVEYEGYELYLVKEDDGSYQIYSQDWEPQCSLEELPSLV